MRLERIMLGEWELFLPGSQRRPKCAVCEQRTDGADVCGRCSRLLEEARAGE